MFPLYISILQEGSSDLKQLDVLIYGKLVTYGCWFSLMPCRADLEKWLTKKLTNAFSGRDGRKSIKVIKSVEILLVSGNTWNLKETSGKNQALLFCSCRLWGVSVAVLQTKLRSRPIHAPIPYTHSNHACSSFKTPRGKTYLNKSRP